MIDSLDLPFTIDRHLRLLLSIDRGHNVARAVQAAIRPGSRVLDAGCGSGLLSCLAVRAGAELVVGADRQHVGLAEAVAKRNGMHDRIRFVEADLTAGELPGVDPATRFDVLLAFIYTNHPLTDGDRAQMVFDLRRRFGTPDCTVIPNGIRYHATGCERLDWDLPTELDDLDRANTTLSSCYGLDFTPLVDQARALAGTRCSRPVDPVAREWRPSGVMASLQFPRSSFRMLTHPTPVADLDYRRSVLDPFPEQLELVATSPGRLTGVLWTQELIVDDRPIWTTETYSPFDEPRLVTANEKVDVHPDGAWRSTNILPNLAAVQRDGQPRTVWPGE
jgi:SAM-dependent methyltransferase